MGKDWMITSLVYVHCDCCAEPDTIAPDSTRSKREAEEDAIDNGWVRRYKDGQRVHYCPPCQEEGHHEHF